MLTWAFQLAVVVVVALVVSWLAGNYRANVERSNIPNDLGFLDNPANFEIPGNDFSQASRCGRRTSKAPNTLPSSRRDRGFAPLSGC